MNVQRIALGNASRAGFDSRPEASPRTSEVIVASAAAPDLSMRGGSVPASAPHPSRDGETLRRFHRCWALDHAGRKSTFAVDSYFARIDQRAGAVNAMAIAIGYPGPSFEVVYWGDGPRRAFGADLAGLDVADTSLGAFGRFLRPRLLAAIVGGEAIGLLGGVAGGDDTGGENAGGEHPGATDRELAGVSTFRLLIVPVLDLGGRTSHLVGMFEFAAGDVGAEPASGEVFRADWSTTTFDSTDDLIDPDVAVI